jgi:hypothetical protein
MKIGTVALGVSPVRGRRSIMAATVFDSGRVAPPTLVVLLERAHALALYLVTGPGGLHSPARPGLLLLLHPAGMYPPLSVCLSIRNPRHVIVDRMHGQAFGHFLLGAESDCCLLCCRTVVQFS